MTDTLQANVSSAVTVYARSATVDRQVAGDIVLRALEEGGDALTASQREARDAGNTSGIDLAPVLGEALTITTKAAGQVTTVQSAVVRLTGDRRIPYWVLAWH